MFYDWTIILVIPALILSLYAQMKISGAFREFSKVGNRRGLTGAQVAEALLYQAGITDVAIEHVGGHLTDHYDPRTKTLRLSDNVYGSSSLAAIGVAAHETGHAMQHDEGYAALGLRSAVVPIARFGSFLGVPLVFIGLLFGGSASVTLINLGILLFSATVLFQLITLPVEFNASRRAVAMLGEYNYLAEDELFGAKKVLSAAALTYVAAAASSALTLLRLVLLSRNRR